MIRHIVHQPFVFATGLAALVHSTWSLGTLFTGPEPEQFTFAWLAWAAPAFLIAFAMDIGQIVTSAEIRAGERTRAKYLTFAVFAVATYYLQWLYIVHHMPALDLSSGVNAGWAGAVSLIRDSAIWVIPALLPLSTLLYTLSASDLQADVPAEQPPSSVTLEVEQPPAPLLDVPSAHVVECACGWSKEYSSAEKAQRGLRMHQARHCTLSAVTQNGVHHG